MMKNRIFSCFLALFIVLCTVINCLPTVNADSDTIIVNSKADFLKLAKDFTLDSRSAGKTVNLTADIDFSGSEFVPIPTFCGTFNGNGHTLLGISCESKGSYKGVFRYIDRGGKVSDLNVRAKFVPGGSKSFLGGIAGENSGTISNCTFDGTIKGENVIGGITGNNTDHGQILSCSSAGNIVGENSTGGIAGKNSGFVQNCTNFSAVNTVYEEKKSDISNIETDTAALIENYKNSEEENDEESVLGHTDTGGIVGFSTGILQGCINHGAVGYTHIGYNVGGIAGRQSGYILGCRNHGFIQGRKDVGGIAGQAEPYILLHASELTLQELKSELNSLHSMVNKFITDTDNLGDDARVHLDGISEYAKDARDNTQSIIDQGTDFVDDNLAELNAESAILSNTVDKLVPVFDSLESGGNDLTDAADALVKALEDLELSVPDFGNEIDDISAALTRISNSEYDLKKAALKAKRAVKSLDDALGFDNKYSVEYAFSDLSAAVNDIIAAKKSIRDSIDEIEKIFTTKPEGFEGLGINAKEIVNSLKSIKEKNDLIISSLKTVNKSLGIIIPNTELDLSEFKSAAENMGDSLESLADAMHYISSGLEDLGDAMTNFSDKFENYASDIDDELTKTKENLSESLGLLSDATSDITDALGDMKNIISDLANEAPLEFVLLGDDFRNSTAGLFDSLSGISDEIDGLKNTLSSGKDKITDDLTSVSNQFNRVLNLITDEIEEIKNGVDSLNDIFVDVSDEDIDSARQGKIADCTNSGKVEADRNSGGIAGSIAIEYSKDPEDDIEKPSTLNFTYRTKAILQACVNDGETIGKKDCVGGIVGSAEIGTVYECENYGNTKSTNGNYVGGVAGKSNSSIRKCYAKSKVGGKRYVGGIAGKADTVTSSYTIVNVSGDENLGAVCGYADKSKLFGNFYVDSGLGASDGISYKEKCESISFDRLKDLPDIPARFIGFTVTFIAEGKTVDTRDVKYGSPTSKIKFPEIPPKEGHFGKWQEIDADKITENLTVECDYLPYITILSSEEKNENGKLALALAEGEFTDSAELHVALSAEKAPVNTAENIKVYDISLINTAIKTDDTVKIRLLNENKEHLTVWRLSGGKWEKIKISAKGKYSVAELSGTQNTVCLKYDKKSPVGVAAISISAVFAIGATAVIIAKKRKTSLGK